MQEQTDIRVFIADDHEETVQKMSEFINASAGMKVVGTATDGNSVWKHFEQGNNGVDVALIDIGMPEMNGLKAAGKIKSVCKSSLKIIVITGLDGVFFPAEAIRNHADGFISKSRHKDEIIEAIRRVCNHEIVYLPDPEDSETPADILPRLPELTPNESRVLCLMVKGFTGKAIGDQVGISHAYAERIRNIVLHKFGAKSAAQLGAIAEKYGLCR
ncbi:MAG: response regulator transcription factor [Saprospiraceae bacterium]|nr:response regulator transcription factor [Saprospiraceae bacterium]